MNDREEEYLIKKGDISYINRRRRIEHVGKNIYLYDLSPLAFLVFKYTNLSQILNLEDYDNQTKNFAEAIVMEKTLNIVLSKISYDFYINNISYYIELIVDSIRDELCFVPTVKYDDIKTNEAFRLYLNQYFWIMDTILAGSINIHYNLKDIQAHSVIPWEHAFYVTDYCIKPFLKKFRLEIARYYYYGKEKV